jgi:hypothetical protein
MSLSTYNFRWSNVKAAFDFSKQRALDGLSSGQHPFVRVYWNGNEYLDGFPPSGARPCITIVGSYPHLTCEVKCGGYYGACKPDQHWPGTLAAWERLAAAFPDFDVHKAVEAVLE